MNKEKDSWEVEKVGRNRTEMRMRNQNNIQLWNCERTKFLIRLSQFWQPSKLGMLIVSNATEISKWAAHILLQEPVLTERKGVQPYQFQAIIAGHYLAKYIQDSRHAWGFIWSCEDTALNLCCPASELVPLSDPTTEVGHVEWRRDWQGRDLSLVSLLEYPHNIQCDII